jgi:hypothetical protein
MTIPALFNWTVDQTTRSTQEVKGLSNYKDQTHFWEANSYSDGQEFLAVDL